MHKSRVYPLVGGTCQNASILQPFAMSGPACLQVSLRIFWLNHPAEAPVYRFRDYAPIELQSSIEQTASTRCTKSDRIKARRVLPALLGLENGSRVDISFLSEFRCAVAYIKNSIECEYSALLN